MTRRITVHFWLPSRFISVLSLLPAPPLLRSTGYCPCALSLPITTSRVRGLITTRCPRYPFLASAIRTPVHRVGRRKHILHGLYGLLPTVWTDTCPPATTRFCYWRFSRCPGWVSTGGKHSHSHTPARSSSHLPIRSFECPPAGSLSSHPDYSLSYRLCATCYSHSAPSSKSNRHQTHALSASKILSSSIA